MTIIAINPAWIEIIVLPLAAAIFGFTVYFFIKSRKTLSEMLQATKRSVSSHQKKQRSASFKRSSLVELEEQFARMRYETERTSHLPEPLPAKPPHKEDNLVAELKNTIAQQQKMLDSYLDKVEELESQGKRQLNEKIADLEVQIDELHSVIERKDEEINELQQDAATAERLTSKIEEVYQEFDQLQAKMAVLEKQASRANNLAIELEDAKYAYEQIHKDISRKQEKLEETMQENQRMRQLMHELEDKLSEANLQRQQLQKKVQFLTDLNNDMQGIADTNKKLQTELRRIGELESMLNIMEAEREHLLKKRREK